MDISSLPQYPSGLDTPSNYCRQLSDSDETAIAIAILAMLTAVPLFVCGMFVIGAIFWWIWCLWARLIAPLAAWLG